MSDELKWAQGFFNTYGPLYTKYSNYYEGVHAQIISEVTRTYFAKLLGGLKDNLCPTVVDTLADRLIIGEFTSDEDVIAEYVNNLWKRQRLVSKVLGIHSEAVKIGDSYIIVWPDPITGVPVIYPQENGLMAVRYDDNGETPTILEAVKRWESTDAEGRKIIRVTRYLPDRIERYWAKSETYTIQSATSYQTNFETNPAARATDIQKYDEQLQPYDMDGSPAIFSHPWGRVPVFHFPNSLKPTKFAQSELRDVCPLQDALNKTLIDMHVAEEFAGFRQKWATGAEIPVDPETGREVEQFQSAIDRIWIHPNPETRFGEFESTDLKQFIEVMDNTRLEIARVSRTPLHLFMLNTANFPSGEALKNAEAPLIAKVRKRQAVWGDTWEDVMSFCCQLAGLSADAEITCNWENTEPVSPKEEAELQTIKQALGVSKQQSLIELGYSTEEIEAMKQQRAEEAEAGAAAMQAAMVRFDRGGNNSNPQAE